MGKLPPSRRKLSLAPPFGKKNAPCPDLSALFFQCFVENVGKRFFWKLKYGTSSHNAKGNKLLVWFHDLVLPSNSLSSKAKPILAALCALC